MVRLFALLLTVTGCNELFGLERTRLLDAKIIDPNNPDAYRPVVPPDGTTVCGAPPSFETWTYAARTIPFNMEVGSFGLYGAPSTTHLIVTPVAGNSMWDVALAGTATEIPSLVPPSGRSISSVAVSPDGAAIWFKIGSATHVALRETGFRRDTTELGVPNAYEILPGAPGFYAGELRMVVRLRDLIADSQAYVELSSSDGVMWTRGQTLPFGGSGYFAAALSPDGCTLLFSRMEGGATFALYSANRMTSGEFAAPVRLDAATAAAGGNAINPALAPGGQSVWFTVFGQGLFEGHP